MTSQISDGGEPRRSDPACVERAARTATSEAAPDAEELLDRLEGAINVVELIAEDREKDNDRYLALALHGVVEGSREHVRALRTIVEARLADVAAGGHPRGAL
jgi:hypothetical protein